MVLIKLTSYVREKDGATAIEFGLLAVPFFMLIMGIIELSLFYASGVMLEGATTNASRVVRTGQAQNAADPQQAFEDRMCESVGVIIDCDRITFEAINFGNSFSGISTNTPSFDTDGNLTSSGFDIGESEDVIMIRLAYRHNFVFPMIGRFLGDNTDTNSALHLSTTVLRTEPYEF